MHNTVTKAGVNKPCVVFEGTGIKCFPHGVLEYFNYIPTISDADSDLSGLHSSLNAALSYLCASLVYDIFEMSSQSERMKLLAKELIAT